MKKRFQNCKAGSTLVEVVVAITILGLVCAPICSSLVLAARVNARSEQVMAAQLSVSSAVERLMAEGVTAAGTSTTEDVIIAATKALDGPYYKITVTSRTITDMQVTTYVRATPGGGT